MNAQVAIALALTFSPSAKDSPTLSICPCSPCKCGDWCACDEPPEIQWRKDYAAAMIESKETNKPLLLYFTGPGCAWCLKLEASTWKNKDVRRELAENFVAVKLNGEEQPKLAKLLWVRRYPTLIMAAPDGTILSFDEGFVEPISFRLRLKRAMKDVEELKPLLTFYSRYGSKECNDLKAKLSANPSLIIGYRMAFVEDQDVLQRVGIVSVPTLRRSDRPQVELRGYRGDDQALREWLK